MEFNNIKSTIRVARIELNSMFYSPVAWLILVIFAVQIGYGFSTRISEQIKYIHQGHEIGFVTSKVFTDHMYGFITGLLKTLYLYIPLLTMGLMSKEFYSGSIKLLYSSPIKNSSIILGKFLFMMIYGLVLMSILGIFVLFSAIVVKDFELPHVLTTMLGLYLLFLAYSAIGLFMSSLTKYQVVAALGTLAILAALNYVGQIGQDIDFVRNITYWLSISGRSYSFIFGLISSEDVAYYIMIVFFFLSLSILKLNAEKVIMSKKVQFLKYSVILLITIVAGLLTSSPIFKVYYDATSVKENTLSAESKEVIDKLKGDITITTYVNLLCEDVSTGLPRYRKQDEKLFEKYLRFKPDIKLNYVYYWDKVNNQYLNQRYEGLTDEEKAKRYCISESLNYDMFMTPQQISKYAKSQGVDLKAESNQFIRIVDCGDGQKATLRVYNDNERQPGEAEISSALKRFVSPSPTVGFLPGYGSRDINNYGDRGYYLFAYDKNFRKSLLNQGFDTKVVNPDSDSFDDIDILVISDIRDSLSDVALAKVNRYIESGRNLFILGDYNRGENMNKITQTIGVKFENGLFVSPNKFSSPTVLFSNFTEECISLFPSFSRLQRDGWRVTLPTCAPIDYSQVDSFNVVEVLRTPKDGWIEYETTDFVDGQFIFNAEANEKKGRFPALIALNRSINGREQRIMISGDADFIANQELAIERSEGSGANYKVISASFRWLSDDRFPVDDTVAEPTDDMIYVSKFFNKWIKTVSYVVIPLIFILSAMVIIGKRQRK